MKIPKQLFLPFLAGTLCMGQPILLAAAPNGTSEASAGLEPALSYNLHGHNYSRWASVSDSSLIPVSNGYQRVENLGDSIVVETYSPAFELLSSKEISPELDYFAGHHFDGTNHFLVFGQVNDAESSSTEIARVVKYNSDFSSRLGATSDLKGLNTKYIDMNTSFADSPDGKTLYLRMGHTMFKSSDGRNHQAALCIAVNKSSMSKSGAMYGVANVDYNGYVSHSFNQYSLIDHNGHLISVDHGDAHPRSIVLYANLSAPNTANPFVNYEDSSYLNNNGIARDLQTIAGQSGDNTTGVSLGDFIDTGKFYLAAYAQNSNVSDSLSGRKVKLVSLSSELSSLRSSSPKVTFTSSMDGSNPYLVQNADGSAVLLWNEVEDSRPTDTLYFATVSKEGSVGTPMSVEGAPLSDCHPILVDGKIIWYTTQSSMPAFYTLDAKNGSLEIVDLNPKEYEILFQSDDNGFISFESSRLEAGQKASFQPRPLYGYQLKNIQIQTESGVIPSISDENGIYSFEMPEEDVSVLVEFEPIQNPYPDVPASSSQASAIAWCKEHGILTGYDDGAFHGSDAISRAMLATILWRMNGSEPASGGFADVPQDCYFTVSSAWAKAAGYFTGNRQADGTYTFNGNDPITRQDFAAVMYRYAQKNNGVSQGTGTSLDAYSDSQQIGSWAREALKWAIGQNLLPGVYANGPIYPVQAMSRADAAEFIYRYFNSN